jgi:RimJ/RimL family protein N-acetyltransferase
MLFGPPRSASSWSWSASTIPNYRAGVVIAYDADLSNGVCSFGLAADPSLDGTGLVTDGLVLLIDYLFQMWPFRKLCADAVEFDFRRFAHNERLA